jgi:hypothetical protein
MTEARPEVVDLTKIDDEPHASQRVVKKRVHDDDDESSEERLYKPTLSCPYCFDKLGCVSGLVLCAITSCRPVLHLVCEACVPKLPKINGAATCGVCRQPVGSIVPLGSLLDEQRDGKAGASLEQAVKRVRSDERATVPAAALSIALPVVAPLSAAAGRPAAVGRHLQDCRESYALAAMGAALPGGEAGFTIYSDHVPAYEGTDFPLTRQGCTSPKLAWRLDVASGVLGYLRNTFGTFNFSATADQRCPGHWGYMVIDVTPKSYPALLRARKRHYMDLLYGYTIPDADLVYNSVQIRSQHIPDCDKALFESLRTTKEVISNRKRICRTILASLKAEFPKMSLSIDSDPKYRGYVALLAGPTFGV